MFFDTERSWIQRERKSAQWDCVVWQDPSEEPAKGLRYEDHEEHWKCSCCLLRKISTFSISRKKNDARNVPCGNYALKSADMFM